MSAVRINLLNFNRTAMEQWFVDQDEQPFRARQLLKWIHQAGMDDFEVMTNLSKVLRERLAEQAEVRAPGIGSEQLSADGTCKWLMRLDQGNGVETVFIPEAGRGTLCVSSQVGCALNCSFCATARQGYNRNLEVAEIIGQVWRARRRLEELRGPGRHITNVVMMGMGEPLMNFDNVTAAMDLMMDDLAMGLARKRVTLSTVGLVPVMDRLRERSGISLAVSLHAADDELRDELVPLNSKYPLSELIPACKRYVAGTRAKVTFEYVMLDGVNDGIRQARQLVRLLQGVPAKVNLIPFNPFPDTDYRRSPPEAIEKFREVLNSAGLVTITRKTRGDDIDAACGQLVGRVQDRTRRSTGRLAGGASPDA